MSESLVEPVETSVSGEDVERPFQKFKVGDQLLTIDKVKDGYTYRLDKDDERVIPTREISDHFWRKGRTTASMLKDLKKVGAVPKDFDKTKFQNEIGKVLDVQLRNWNTTEIEKDLRPEEEKLEDRYEKETIEEANRILREENILKQVKTVLDYKIAGESKNKMGIFLHCLTKDSDQPLIIYGVSKQAEGKSFLVQQILELYPGHQIEEVTDMTPASIYRIAQEHGKDYYDGKIVNLGELSSEDEDDDVSRIFRQLVTEGKVTKQLVMDTEDGQKTKKLELEGAPVLIATTTDADKIDEEDLSRGITYSPDLGDQQDKLIRKFQNKQNELPEEVFYPEEIQELEETLTCCLDIISEQDISIRNPYTQVMDKIVPLDSDNARRDYPKVMKIVAQTVTKLFHKQRPSTELSGQRYCFTSWEDIVRGLMINQDFINNMLDNTLESALQVFETIERKVAPNSLTYQEMETIRNEDGNIGGDPFTNADVRDWTGMKEKTVMNTTKTLDRQKLIFKDYRHRPHKHHLPHDALVQRGITPNTHLTIVESALDGKGVEAWFKHSAKYWSLERPEEVKKQLILEPKDLPYRLETGLGRDDSYELPIYLQDTEEKGIYTVLEIKMSETDLYIELNGPNGSRTIHKFADTDEDDENEEDDEPEFDDWDDAGLNPDKFT